MSQNIPMWIHNDNLLTIKKGFSVEQNSEIDQIFETSIKDLFPNNTIFLNDDEDTYIFKEKELDNFESNLLKLIGLINCSNESKYDIAENFIRKFS
jgi:hypothetical protein